MSARTQQEILDRIAAIKADDDIFGFSQEVLLGALDFDHAKPLLKDGVTKDQWPDPGDAEGEARDYLKFAIGKIEGHRGISASRSVQKLVEFAWLMGRDDVVTSMLVAPYAQYGAPEVKAFAFGMGWDQVWGDSPALNRMASGLPCRDGCEGGCGVGVEMMDL